MKIFWYEGMALFCDEIDEADVPDCDNIFWSYDTYGPFRSPISNPAIENGEKYIKQFIHGEAHYYQVKREEEIDY